MMFTGLIAATTEKRKKRNAAQMNAQAMAHGSAKTRQQNKRQGHAIQKAAMQQQMPVIQIHFLMQKKKHALMEPNARMESAAHIRQILLIMKEVVEVEGVDLTRKRLMSEPHLFC